MKPLTLVLVVLSCAAVGLAACGESKEDKAKSQVCDARADITKQVESLKSLTISTSTPSDLKATLTNIKNDLSKMRDAQSDLNSDRKEQVKSATQTFESQLQQIVTTSISDLSVSNAKAQLQSAVSALESAYKQALAPIDC